MAADKRKVMVRLFEQKSRPTMFLASHAQTMTTLAEDIEIDIVRGLETFSVDITPGAGSRSNKKSRYTTKTYTPPMYNESYSLTAQELQNRMPGQTAYDASSDAYQTTLFAMISDKQVMMQDKELRAIELQTRDAFFNGKIVLQNGDEIDFKKKATHDITGTDWSDAAGLPLDDIEAGCQLCRKDGLISATKFKLILADDTVEALKANDQFVAKANLRHVMNVNMEMPSDVNAEGATFHGLFSAGSYIVELWAYPQFYEIPVGFGLANEGTKQPYIPSASALLMPTAGLRLDLWFGGVPQVSNQVDPELAALGLNGTLGVVEADFVPYAYLDDRAECIECGVKTRPLFVPNQIDGFVTFKTLLG